MAEAYVLIKITDEDNGDMGSVTAEVINLQLGDSSTVAAAHASNFDGIGEQLLAFAEALTMKCMQQIMREQRGLPELSKEQVIGLYEGYGLLPSAGQSSADQPSDNPLTPMLKAFREAMAKTYDKPNQ